MPWHRDQLARLTTEVIDRLQADVLGFDVLFVEPDSFPAHDDPDTLFANALAGRPVALGFYFTRGKEPQSRGRLPAPVLLPDSFPQSREYATRWNGFVGSIPPLAQGAPAAGFLNVLLDADPDGVVRSVPLIARYTGRVAQPGYYESLALAVFRMATDSRALVPVFAPGGAPPMQSLALANDAGQLRVPLDGTASILVPYRGPGGAAGGSFRHVPAADVIHGALAAGELKGKIVLVGSSAPGLESLSRVTKSPSLLSSAARTCAGLMS
jgi:adenylate cyclase